MWTKIAFKIVKMDYGDFFLFSPVLHTEGHPYKLFVNYVRKEFLLIEL